ncbi:MAG TPA: TonB family protein [Candidatus Polarisedimenticolia bacterium]|nr:TonB family protein [Candidatus Polarisedimenticolia bacterium]
MRSRFPLLALSAVAISLFLPLRNSAGQTAPDANTPQTGVSVTKLYDPVYPALARQARISGDVNLTLHVRQDGSIESVDVVSGHPMLKESALDSTEKSEFECHACSEALTTYSLVYTFGLTAAEKCCEATEDSADTEQSKRARTGVVRSQNHITILADPACICDPSADVRRVHSAKCLYLWKCGIR